MYEHIPVKIPVNGKIDCWSPSWNNSDLLLSARPRKVLISASSGAPGEPILHCHDVAPCPIENVCLFSLSILGFWMPRSNQDLHQLCPFDICYLLQNTNVFQYSLPNTSPTLCHRLEML